MGGSALRAAVDEQADLGEWNYRRMISALVAGLGCAISVYLAVYQYGGLTHVWEPFFGAGSAVVLNSGLLDSVSRLVGFTIHDAALGAIGYAVEAGLALAGIRNLRGPPRWSDLAYAGVVVLMGLTSLVLVVLQAAVFHAGCTLCLTSAAISWAIVLLARHDLAVAAGALIHGWSKRKTRKHQTH